ALSAHFARRSNWRVPPMKSSTTEKRAALGHGSQQGFTLLEVMVAITIFAMVLVAIYASWSAILRGSKAGLKAAAEAQRTRVALRAFEESLGATELFLENIRYYSFMADTSGD